MFNSLMVFMYIAFNDIFVNIFNQLSIPDILP